MTTCSSCGTGVQAEARFCPSCGARLVAPGGNEDPLIGQSLRGKYRVLSQIGSGSMGTVYLGEHVGLKKKVALKVIHPDLQVGDETLQRFHREGIAAGRFNHANAVQVFDFDKTEDGTFFLAMEHVEGDDLKVFLTKEMLLPVGEALNVIRQVLAALAEAHASGIVHRDLKPENIMVIRRSSYGLTVKVLDFGLSKLIDVPLEASLRTQPGRVMGTPRYMAPEQASGEGADHRSDLYAVGLILYELVTGKPPFQGESFTELLVAQATEPVPPLVEANPDVQVPAELEELLEKALEKTPDDRFQSAMEMLAALDKIDPEGAPRAPGAAAKAKRQKKGRRGVQDERRRWPAVVVGAVAVAVIGVAGWRVLGSAGSPPDVPRVSMMDAKFHTEEQARYVSLLERSRSSLRAGDSDDALARVQEAQGLACRDSEAFLVRGLVYRAKGDDDTALADLREALTLDEGYAEAAAIAGWVLLDRGDLAGALESFERASEMDPDSAQAVAGLGALHYLGDELDQARDLLTRATELEPGLAAAYYWLGRTLLDAGDPVAAGDALVEAKRNDPLSWETPAALGRAYLEQGRPDEAEKQLREAIQRNAEALEPRVDLATLLIENERHEDALELIHADAREILDSGRRNGPEYAQLLVLDGAALQAVGRDQEAIESLETALAAGGSDARTLTLLGILYQAAGRNDEAIAQYDLAIQLDRDMALAWLNRGLACFALERFEQAEQDLMRAADLDPLSAYPHYGLGVLYMDFLGKPGDAIDRLRTYQELGGEDSRVDGWIRRLEQ